MGFYVKITDEMKRQAEDFAMASLGETFDRFNYDRSVRLNKIYVGKLGEIIFAEFMKGKGVELAVDFNSNSGGKPYDFSLMGKTIDVKSGTKPHHRRLLIVQDHFEHSGGCDYYPAVNVYANHGEVFGYATKEDIKNSKVEYIKSLSHVIFYKDLRDINELAEVLSNDS